MKIDRIWCNFSHCPAVPPSTNKKNFPDLAKDQSIPVFVGFYNLVSSLDYFCTKNLCWVQPDWSEVWRQQFLLDRYIFKYSYIALLSQEDVERVVLTKITVLFLQLCPSYMHLYDVQLFQSARKVISSRCFLTFLGPSTIKLPSKSFYFFQTAAKDKGRLFSRSHEKVYSSL